MSPPRNDNETTSAHQPSRYQSDKPPGVARNIAAQLAGAVPTPPRRHRRDVTVYACNECDQRYLGEQWCTECARPCTRIGIGGACPSCDEPVTVDELLQAHNDHSPAPRPGEPSLHQSRGGSH